MQTPSTTWDNEWLEVPGPEAILVSVVQNPKLLPLQGKTIADIAKMWGKDPIDTIFDLLIEDGAFTMRRCLWHVGAGCGAGPPAAVGLNR